MVINSSSYGRSSNDTHMWAHVHKQDMVGGVRASPGTVHWLSFPGPWAAGVGSEFPQEEGMGSHEA